MQIEINLDQEQLIPLNEVPKLLPRRRGKKIHYQTIYRWATKGTKQYKLATVKVGGIRYTSVEALERFCQAHNPSLLVGDYHDAVEAALDRAGM